MEQTFDLNKMGLAPMTGEEMRETDGGGLWSWVAGAVAAIVEAPAIVSALAVVSLADAVYELGTGLVRGWNSVK